MRKIFLTLSFIALNICLLSAQNTKGRDFWVTFGENGGGNNTTSSIALQIRIVTKNAANVNLLFTDNTSLNRVVAVPANSIQTITLNYQEKLAVHCRTSGITNKSLHITSDEDILVYAATFGAFSSETYNIHPVHLFGNNYFQINYTQQSVHNGGEGYMIIATQNNTNVFENGTSVATLNTGQVYTSYINGRDRTGYNIISDKPIAYFAANTCAEIPIGSTTGCDCLYEQLFTTQFFGNDFFVPVSSTGADRVRIVATQNNTNIIQTGGIIISGTTNLNAGQFLELEINQANRGCYITTDKPVEVALYLKSAISTNANGDPSIVVVPPISQTEKNIKISPFVAAGTSTLTTHFALIATPTNTKNSTSVSINGGASVALSGGSWSDNVSAGYSYYNMPLANDYTIYEFSNDNGILVWGYGLGVRESYSYLASSIENEDVEIYFPDNVDGIECFTAPAPVTFTIREAWRSTQTDVGTYVSPVVGDIDGDGIAEIFVAKNIDWGTFQGIYIFKGSDRNNPVLLNTVVGHCVHAGSLILGKVNVLGGDRYLIFMIGANNGNIYAYDAVSASSTPVWISNQPVLANYHTTNPNPILSLSLADFNNDGIPEIYCGGRIFDASTGLFLAEVPAGGNVGRKSGFPHNAYGYFSIAADVIGDSRLELCVGTEVYNVNIVSRTNPALNSLTLAASIPDVNMGGYSIKDGNTIVADINQDGLLDVIITNSSSNNQNIGIVAWCPSTSQLIGKISIPVNNDVRNSVKAVGNIDSNPDLEIVFLMQNKIVALRLDAATQTFNTVYQTTNITETTWDTGLVLFDFDNDGIDEIVYRDNQNFRILKANSSGGFTNINTFPSFSGTGWEQPVIADVDGDGEAEIISVGANSGVTATRGTLRIYKSNGSPWAPARKVWNQYAYNSVNVNEDLTIPRYYFNPATRFAGQDEILGTADDVQPFNAFLKQQTYLNQFGMPYIEEDCDSIIYCYKTINQTICEGTSYDFYGTILTIAGTYTDTIFVTSDCDTIVTLNLDVLPYSTKTINETICEGTSYDFYGTILTIAGTYTDTIFVTSGCDTIVTLNLDVLPYQTKTINDTICNGESYDFYGTVLTTAGTYTDTIFVTSGCDTIVTLNLDVLPYQTKTINDTICNGESYDFYGTVLTTAGTYTDTIIAILCCDTIVTLNLSVVFYHTKTINETICEDESYDFYGTIISTAGTHTHTVLVASGCDTIVTLNLSVVSYHTKTINETICNGESYNFYGTTITTTGIYIDTIPAVLGCDTIVTLDIYFKHCGKIEIASLVEICADDEFIYLHYTILEGSVDCYSVTFNQQALSEGFTNITPCQLIPVSPIKIPIPQKPSPQYVRPNYNYSMAILFEFENDTVDNHTINFDILYPSWIMQQKWNDAIALLNQYYNGGYEWSAYEWYVNDTKIPIDRNSYIYTLDYGKTTLEMGQQYRALLTRADDGVKIFTCPLIPEWRTDITQFPTVVSPQQTIRIQANTKMKVIMWAVTGIKISEQDFHAGENTLIAPYAEGVYLLQFLSDTGNIETRKIIVKK